MHLPNATLLKFGAVNGAVYGTGSGIWHWIYDWKQQGSIIGAIGESAFGAVFFGILTAYLFSKTRAYREAKLRAEKRNSRADAEE